MSMNSKATTWTKTFKITVTMKTTLRKYNNSNWSQPMKIRPKVAKKAAATAWSEIPRLMNLTLNSKTRIRSRSRIYRTLKIMPRG